MEAVHARETGRLLLVDDEPGFREPTAEMLRRRGHRCSVAPDTDVASRLLGEERFDVVISDVRMPGNHKLEFVQALRCDDDAPAVIVVTGYPSVDTAVDAIDLRVFAYLVKPVDAEVLQERVDQALRQVRIRRCMSALESRLDRVHEDVRTLHEAFRTPQREIDGPRMQRLIDGASRTLLSSLGDLGRLENGLRGGAPAAAIPGSVDLTVLSPRENEVLDLIRNGYRVATVARRLRISPHTVRNHLKRIFLKLEVASQAELLEKLKPLQES